MFLPNRMVKVNILVFNRHLRAMTEALGKSGLLHLVNAASTTRGRLLQQLDTQVDIQEIEQKLRRCGVLMEALGIEPTDTPPSVTNLSQEEIAELFDKVDRRYCREEENLSKLLEHQAGLISQSRTLGGFPFQSLKLETVRNLSQLCIEAGVLRSDAIIRARQTLVDDAILVPSAQNPGEMLVLTSRKKRFAVDDTLDKLGFQRLELPDITSGTVEEHRGKIDAELEELRVRINDARMAVVSLGEEFGGLLLAIRKQLNGLLAIRQAQSLFGHSRQLYCVSGWLPAEDLSKLQKLVDEATDGTGVIESMDADEAEKAGDSDEQVPVQLSGNGLTRPFQMLVTNFGMPNYHELDPSFFVGLTFMVMFGYMFGDLGQGGVLFLAGLLAFFKKGASRMRKDVGTLLMCCGGSAMVFGILYGSVFGSEDLLPRLWISPSPMHTKDLGELLLTAVGVGVVFLSVSLIFNIVNHFRAKKYFEGTFDKYGILGLLFYWACLGTALATIITRTFNSWSLFFIIAPLVLLLIRIPLGNLIHNHSLSGEEGGLFSGLLEGAIDTMETLTGYLSGTVSFIRVGAYAISHAALCLAVHSIMEMLTGTAGGTAAKILVFIFGNILIIGFEGMVAAIQCVRLEYYEMFSRFFQGGGVEYKPFKIK